MFYVYITIYKYDSFELKLASYIVYRKEESNMLSDAV